MSQKCEHFSYGPYSLRFSGIWGPKWSPYVVVHMHIYIYIHINICIISHILPDAMRKNIYKYICIYIYIYMYIFIECGYEAKPSILGIQIIFLAARGDDDDCDDYYRARLNI